MTISRVELQGQVRRAQGFTTSKHSEGSKVIVDQSKFQQRFEDSLENKARQVQQHDEMNNKGKRFDAKEKGNGSYAGDGGRRRKKSEQDGKVTLKSRGGFDIKI